MTVTGMRLRQFRGFVDADIELQPLTVLLGVNSAGKSSFGQALAYLRQVDREPSPADDQVDLGNYRSLLHKGGEGPVEIELNTSSGAIAFGFGPRGESNPSLELSLLRWPEAAVDSDSALKIEGVVDGGSAISTVATATPATFVGEHPVRTMHRHGERGWRLESAAGQAITVFPERAGLKLISYRKDSGTVQTVYAPFGMVSAFLSNLRYLRADRAAPQRKYAQHDNVEHPAGWIGADGRHSLAWRSNHAGHRVKMCLPGELPKDIEMARRLLAGHGWEPHEATVAEWSAIWLQHLGLAHSLDAQPTGAGIDVHVKVAVGSQPSALPDVGHGVSQALHVIIGALATPEGGTLVVEQPEAHLHPRAQAGMADLFCSMVYSGRRVVVETHSDTFVRRLRVRAMIDQQLDELARLYSVPATATRCSQPERRKLGAPGALLDWPVDFLAEDWEEDLFALAVEAGAE